MTHKLIVGLVVLCSGASLLTHSFALAYPATPRSAELTFLKKTFPLLDLKTFSKTSPSVQALILATAKGLKNTPTPVKKLPRIPSLPFYSQFKDIGDPTWQKVSCGIASLAMVIDHFSDEAVVPDTLLSQGIKNGAYINSAGWSHQGLIDLAESYGLEGKTVGLADLTLTEAFARLESALTDGPVIASVHYTFEPTNPIPHLVVITGVKDGLVYYSDPAETSGNHSLSAEKFKLAWKKRFIEIRPKT